ncbi:MAG: response regulator [bacterium]
MEQQNTTNQTDANLDVNTAAEPAVTIKKKVLVIDDDENLSSVLVDKLNFSGFIAESAGDGVIGLKKAFEIKPDVILLDVKMPNMSGWETLEKLRTDPWGEHAKVMMLTSIDKPESVAHAMEQGTTVFLVKTNYTLDQIVEKVKEVLTM